MIQPQIQAEPRTPYSVDIPCDDLKHVQPDDPTDVGLLVTAALGPMDNDGVEVFDVSVCTPRWLADNVPADGYEWCRHKFILPGWDDCLLLAVVSDLRATAVGPDWDRVAAYLARYGAWEFEDARMSTTSPQSR